MKSWVEAIPALGDVLIGLTGLPYSMNKAASSLADIVAAFKKKQD